MKIYLFIFSFLFCLFSCKKIIDVNNNSLEPSIIIVPGSPDLHDFTITLTNLTTTTAKFSWSYAGDYQSDSVVYTLILNESEIVSKLRDTEYLISGLEPATTYHLQIKALGSRNDEMRSAYDFTTHDGYTKFEKSFYPNTIPYDIALTPDSSYLVCILNNSRGNLLLSKIDSLGNEIWQKIYPYNARNSKIRSIKDGYIIMADKDLLKIDLDGKLKWHKSFEGTEIWFRSFTEAMNGDLILIGLENTWSISPKIDLQASILKFNSSGELIWRKKYGQSLLNEGFDIIRAENDKEFYVLGSKSSPLNGIADEETQFWIFKINNEGNVIWERTFGDSRVDIPAQIHLINNNLVIGGTSLPRTFFGGQEMQIFRTDLKGELINTISVKKPGYYDFLRAIEPTSDNGYIVCGHISEGTSRFILGLFKFDSFDNLVWSKNYDAGFNFWSSSYSIKQTSDKGFIVPATKFQLYGDGSNLWFLKLNPYGSYE